MARTINFLGLPLITDELPQMAEWLVSLTEAKSPVIVSHINANNYYHLCTHSSLCGRLENNAYLLFDGIGLKMAASWLGLGWVPDVNGTDLFPLVMKTLVKKNIPLYFLGSNEFVIESVVQSLRRRWPEIKIVGSSCGYFQESNEDQIVETINASGAEVLLIGRGFPLQEEFSLRNKTRLNVSLIWNVGGLFDFISNHKPRAPLWMRQMRLEWLFRLVREPRRLWFRTFVVGPWLASHILSQALKLTKPQILKKEV